METPSIKTPDDEEREPMLVAEWDGLSPLPEGATDEGLFEDAPLSTDWDISVENPPHAGYEGPLPHPDQRRK